MLLLTFNYKFFHIILSSIVLYHIFVVFLFVLNIILDFFLNLKGNQKVLANNTIRRCNMLELKRSELLNIQGGAIISAPTYYLFMRFMKWLCSKL